MFMFYYLHIITNLIKVIVKLKFNIKIVELNICIRFFCYLEN